jgi:hypothetical protein
VLEIDRVNHKDFQTCQSNIEVKEMNKASSARRRRVKPVEPHEPRAISEKDCKVYQLISAGFLPSADTVTKDGRPAWCFESLASIVGCKETELAQLLMNQGGRYRPPPGSWH